MTTLLKHALNELVDGNTVLSRAIISKAPIDVLGVLITAQNVNIISACLTSPLFSALMYYKHDEIREVVGLMLYNNADVNVLSGRCKITILYVAILKACPPDVLLQLISPQNINANHNRSTALHKAVRKCYDHNDTVSIINANSLLDHGADCNITRLDGHTPLSAYLHVRPLSHLSLSFVARMIHKTHLAEEVYNAICLLICCNI